MDAKDFLKQIRKIDLLIDNKQIEIDKLRSRAYYPRGNEIQNLVVKIVEYEKEINNEIDKLIDKKREVKAVIDKLDNGDMIDVLYKRYFQYMTWEQIAHEKNYTYQGIHKIHAKALKKVNEYIKVDSFKENIIIK